MAGGSAINTETDDIELVLRIMERDEAALSIIVRRYSGKIIGTLHSKFGGKVCEDTLNEGLDHAIWVVWNKTDSFDENGSLGGFLYTCALNKVYELLRARKPPESVEVVSLETLGDKVAAPEKAEEKPLSPEKKKLYEDLHECIQELPSLQRQIVEIDLVSGCDADNDYLADSLQTSKGSIYVSRSKARGKLKLAMKKRGHFN